MALQLALGNVTVSGPRVDRSGFFTPDRSDSPRASPPSLQVRQGQGGEAQLPLRLSRYSFPDCPLSRDVYVPPSGTASGDLSPLVLPVEAPVPTDMPGYYIALKQDIQGSRATFRGMHPAPVVRRGAPEASGTTIVMYCFTGTADDSRHVVRVDVPDLPAGTTDIDLIVAAADRRFLACASGSEHGFLCSGDAVFFKGHVVVHEGTADDGPLEAGRHPLYILRSGDDAMSWLT